MALQLGLLEKWGGALNFNGSLGYVDAGDDASLNLTNSITIEAWVKPATAQEICWVDPGPGNVGIASKVEKSIGSANWSWQLRYGSPENCRLGFQFHEAGAGSKWVTAKEDLTSGQWYHLAGTFDETDIKFYLNGELKDTNTLTAIAGYLNKLLIASDGWSEFTGYFNGSVDEFRVFNRALDAAEIKAIFEATK